MVDDKISVIIPIYKVEAYLKECLDSVINQTYKNLEIILVDDGSPDNSGKMCDEYAQKDSRIKVIHKENGGLSSARNAGLDIATGEYVCFIDSDDVIDERYIEILHSMCAQNNVDVAVCDIKRFTDVIEKEDATNEIKLIDSKELQSKMYVHGEATQVVIVCNKLYKRYIYENLRFPVGKIHEDEFTTYKALYSSKTAIAISNLKLYYYRCNPNGIMGNKYTIKRLDYLEALEQRMKFYSGRNEKMLYEKTLAKYSLRLRSSYVKVYLYIEENKQQVLDGIWEKANKIISEVLKCKEIKLNDKMDMLTFKMFPKMYAEKNKEKYAE